MTDKKEKVLCLPVYEHNFDSITGLLASDIVDTLEELIEELRPLTYAMEYYRDYEYDKYLAFIPEMRSDLIQIDEKLSYLHQSLFAIKEIKEKKRDPK